MGPPELSLDQGDPPLSCPLVDLWSPLSDLAPDCARLRGESACVWPVHCGPYTLRYSYCNQRAGQQRGCGSYCSQDSRTFWNMANNCDRLFYYCWGSRGRQVGSKSCHTGCNRGGSLVGAESCCLHHPSYPYNLQQDHWIGSHRGDEDSWRQQLPTCLLA